MQATSTTPMTPPKPRQRRRWVYAIGFVLLLIGTLVGYYFITGWQADRALNELHAEMDAEDPNWRWADLAAELKPPPDDVNSAKQVLKVAALLKIRAFNPAGKWWTGGNDKALNVRNARISDDYMKPLRAAFAALDPKTLTEARKLKDFPDGRFAIDADIDNPFLMSLDFIQSTREIVHLLESDALLRGQEKPHDLSGAAESCLALVYTAHAINDHPLLISQLVRMAEWSITVGAVERLTGQGIVPEADLARLQKALEREADTNVIYLGMRGERAGANQFYEAIRSGKATVSGIFTGPGNPGGGAEGLLDLFPGFFLRGQAEHLRLANENIRASKLPEPARSEAFRKIEAKVRESRSISVRLLAPAFMKVADAEQRTKAYLRCAIAGLAVERYRLRHMNWPGKLDDVVKAGLLQEVPNDPYDGKPLRFKRTLTGVLVYSVGPDKTDDGGKLDRDQPMARATDMGFELWNPNLRGVAPPAEEEVP